MDDVRVIIGNYAEAGTLPNEAASQQNTRKYFFAPRSAAYGRFVAKKGLVGISFQKCVEVLRQPPALRSVGPLAGSELRQIF